VPHDGAARVADVELANVVIGVSASGSAALSKSALQTGARDRRTNRCDRENARGPRVARDDDIAIVARDRCRTIAGLDGGRNARWLRPKK